MPKTRDDETVRTQLQRASDRCRRVTERCAAVGTKGLRRPERGPTETIDPGRLERVRPVPPVSDEPEDLVSRLIARVLARGRR